MNIDIITGLDGVFDKAVSWDPVRRLDFDLPFQDMKPSIYLGVCTCTLSYSVSVYVHVGVYIPVSCCVCVCLGMLPYMYMPCTYLVSLYH